MHSFCSGGDGTRTRDTKFWLQLSLKKKIPGASRVLRICLSAKIVASVNRGSWPKFDNVKIGKAKPQKCILKVFCWTHWKFKIFTGATVLLTSKLTNSPQNFCQQEPFVKTNVSCMSITPSLYRISTAPSLYADVINKNFAHQYIFLQRSDCYARCDWSLPMIYWSTDKWMTSKLVFFVLFNMARGFENVCGIISN